MSLDDPVSPDQPGPEYASTPFHLPSSILHLSPGPISGAAAAAVTPDRVEQRGINWRVIADIVLIICKTSEISFAADIATRIMVVIAAPQTQMVLKPSFNIAIWSSEGTIDIYYTHSFIASHSLS